MIPKNAQYKAAVNTRQQKEAVWIFAIILKARDEKISLYFR